MVNADPRQRLLELSAERGVSLAALSALVGRNASYLQQFVRKGSPRKLEEGDRRTLARFFGVEEAELGGLEEKYPELSSSRQGEYVAVPRLALGASAGPGAFASEERAFDHFGFSPRWLRAQGFDPAQLSAIAVEGDSMEPLLRDGDEILVDRTPRPLRDGIHVVGVDDTVLVKRVQTGIPGKLVLESLNPAYRPIELPGEAVRVIGRVVWKAGRL